MLQLSNLQITFGLLKAPGKPIFEVIIMEQLEFSCHSMAFPILTQQKPLETCVVFMLINYVGKVC